MWFLWKERFNHKYNNRKLEEEEIIPRALGWLSSYLEAQSNPASTHFSGLPESRAPRAGRWHPPPEGIYKLNYDAGVLQQQGVGLGAIIRDWRGGFVGATVKREKGICRPIEAEAKAMMMGLREANRRSISPLIIESDCQVLVNLLNRGEDDFTEVGILCDELKRMAGENEAISGVKVKWEFSPRKTNSLAHWLAHSGSGWNHQVVWIDDPPLTLLRMIETDSGGVSLDQV